MILHSVNIKYKIVKLKILKILAKSQKIVEQANSILNNTTLTIYCEYTILDGSNINKTEIHFILCKLLIYVQTIM